MPESRSGMRYALALLLLFVVIWSGLAWRPSFRHDWILENLLVFASVPVLALSYRRLPLSRLSYTAIFFFLSLHTVGAHYTYAEVPYDQWVAALTGETLNHWLGWQRNHFDRLVHLLYGVLLIYPLRELFLRITSLQGYWSYLFPLLIVMSTSMLYELLEWGAAIFFGGELGMAYLGTQGDIWDAHKDMALATLGALVSSILIAITHFASTTILHLLKNGEGNGK